MAKRGYNRDTIRGGASDWDVSRPFSSYLRLLGTLLTHPIGFYEVLPKIPDPRAPGMFLGFCSVVSAIFWFAFESWAFALGALLLLIPISLVAAALLHLGSFGGRYEFTVTWRVVAYPLGFAAPLLAVPYLRWFVAFLFVFLLAGVGLRTAQEIPTARSFLVSAAVALLVGVALWYLVGL